jgi:acetyl esterase/lipase
MKTILGIILVFALTIVPTKNVRGEASVDSNVVYGMYSGLALLLDVHYPASSNGHGVIVIPGSGWQAPLDFNARPLKSIYDGSNLGLGVVSLLNNGYTIFVINHRSAPRFPYPAAVEDAQRAVRFIRSNSEMYQIDPEKIGAFGGSSGGHLVSMLGVLDGNGDPSSIDATDRVSAKVQAVVALWPVTDFVTLAKDGGGGANNLFLGAWLSRGQIRNLGSDEAFRSQEVRIHEQASPTSHVSPDDAPFLLMHGDVDVVVPPNQSEVFSESLSSESVPVEFIVLPGRGHGGRPEGARGPNPPGGALPPEYFGSMLELFEAHLLNDSE